MPEQLTKHPDVTLEVLRSAGAQCGVGAPQQILTSCPQARFCKLPGGEICVYGLGDAAQMKQISPADWQAVLQAVTAAPAAAASAGGGAAALHPMPAMLSALGLVLIGVAVGWVLKRR